MQKPIQSSQSLFVFKNLQPINYLKTFNQMLEYINKSSSTSLSNNIKSVNTNNNKQQQLNRFQFKLNPVKFSRYPLHQYYYEMQGVMDTIVKKQNQMDEENRGEKQFQKYQNDFITKHNNIVKNVINRLIEDNQNQRNYLVKQKRAISQFTISNNLQVQGQSQSNIQKQLNCSLIDKNTLPNLTQRINTHNNIKEKSIKLIKMNSQPKLRLNKISNHFTVNNINNKSNAVLHRPGNKQLQEKIQGQLNVQKKNKEANIKNSAEINSEHLIGQSRKMVLLEKVNLNDIRKQKINQLENNPIFKKLIAPSKYEKFHKKNDLKMEGFFTMRNKQTTNNNQVNNINNKNNINNINTSRSNYPLTERKGKNNNIRKIINSSMPVDLVTNKVQSNKVNINKKKTYNLQKSKDTIKSFHKYENQQQNDSDQEFEQKLRQFYQQISISPQKNKQLLVKNKDNSQGLISSIVKRGQQAQGDKQLVDRLCQLQEEQTMKQREYGNRIDKRINEMKMKVDGRIRDVLSFQFRIDNQRNIKGN